MTASQTAPARFVVSLLPDDTASWTLQADGDVTVGRGIEAYDSLEECLDAIGRLRFGLARDRGVAIATKPGEWTVLVAREPLACMDSLLPGTSERLAKKFCALARVALVDARLRRPRSNPSRPTGSPQVGNESSRPISRLRPMHGRQD